MKKKIIIAALALLILVAAGFVYYMGPRNVIGILLYDQRREGDLKVGDVAPNVSLNSLDGKTQIQLRDCIAGKPLVMIFGSYT